MPNVTNPSHIPVSNFTREVNIVLVIHKLSKNLTTINILLQVSLSKNINPQQQIALQRNQCTFHPQHMKTLKLTASIPTLYIQGIKYLSVDESSMFNINEGCH